MTISQFGTFSVNDVPLPDELVLHILGFVPVEEAGKVAFLSKDMFANVREFVQNRNDLKKEFPNLRQYREIYSTAVFPKKTLADIRINNEEMLSIQENLTNAFKAMGKPHDIKVRLIMLSLPNEFKKYEEGTWVKDNLSSSFSPEVGENESLFQVAICMDGTKVRVVRIGFPIQLPSNFYETKVIQAIRPNFN